MNKKHFLKAVTICFIMVFLPVSQIVSAQKPGEKAKLNKFLEKNSKWEMKTKIIKDDRTFHYPQKKCLPVEKKMEPQNIGQIMIMSDTMKDIFPGNFIQGKEFSEGRVSSVPIARSPVKLSISLKMKNSATTITTIDRVNEAIQKLQNKADKKVGKIKVVPQNLQYAAEEAYSYEQTLLTASVPLEFSKDLEYLRYRFLDNPMSVMRGYNTYVIVKIAQPMYTVSVVKENYPAPADMLGDKVVLSDLQEQEKLGRIGADNPLLFIESVIYGRMLIFTVAYHNMRIVHDKNRTTEINVREAVLSSLESYKTGKELSANSKHVLGRGQISLINYGGEESVAKEAVRSGNYGKFFTDVKAIQAVPLYFVAKDLRNNTASFGYQVYYKKVECGMKIPVRVGDNVMLEYMSANPVKHKYSNMIVKHCYYGKAESRIKSIGLQEYYPHLDNVPATLTLKGNPGAIQSAVTVFQIQSREDIMRNNAWNPNHDLLGSWDTTSYPYYYKAGYGDNQEWRMHKVGGNKGDTIHYGDEVVIKNVKYWTYSLCDEGTSLQVKEHNDNCRWKVQ